MRVKEAGIPEGRPADTLRAQRHYLGVSPRNATQDFPKRKARKDTTGDRMKQDSAKEFARKHLQVTTWVVTMVVAVRESLVRPQNGIFPRPSRTRLHFLYTLITQTLMNILEGQPWRISESNSHCPGHTLRPKTLLGQPLGATLGAIIVYPATSSPDRTHCTWFPRRFADKHGRTKG
jgi:hypothetical protein